MGNWRPGQKDAIIRQARERGMVANDPAPRVAAPPARPQPEKEAPATVKPARAKASAIRRRQVMNPVEEEFSLILEARRKRGEFREWEFEAIKLHLGGGAYYTLDFLARREDGKPVLFEIKGRRIVSRDTVRIKVVERWMWLFDFEVWQKADGGWKQL